MQTKSGTDFHILTILFLNWKIQKFSTMVMLCGCDRSASTFNPGKWCSWSSNGDMVIFSLVTLVVTALPLLIIPPTLLVAATRAAIHGHCCQVWRCSPVFKDFKEHQSCSNISSQIMTTQADQFKTTNTPTRASINLIRWSSSNPPGSCFLSSWSPWFTWAPSLAAFYQGNAMFFIKRHVYFSIVFNQRYSGSTWRWRSLRLNCPLQLHIRRFSKKSTQCQND